MFCNSETLVTKVIGRRRSDALYVMELSKENIKRQSFRGRHKRIDSEESLRGNDSEQSLRGKR